MLSQPPERTQTDGLQQAYSDEAALTDFGPSLARQEFAQEADVNYILGRFGIGTAATKTPYYTDTNFTIDLQQAIDATRAATAAWGKVPEEIKTKYGDWMGFVTALASGQYERDQAQLDKDIAAKAQTDAEYAAFLETRKQSKDNPPNDLAQ